MPDRVWYQFNYLCQEINKVEWSGVLFYTIEGTLKDPKNLKIQLTDILPMDKGNSTFTSYDLDDRVMLYMMDNPHLLGKPMGHIHSHHIMNTFFSGVDQDELHDNAPNHNIYLSLIVNNKQEFSCRLAYIEKVKGTFEKEFLDVDGTPVKHVEEVEEQTLVFYECEIVREKPDFQLPEDFVKKVVEINKPKAVTYGSNLYGYPSKAHTWGARDKVDYSRDDSFFNPLPTKRTEVMFPGEFEDDDTLENVEERMMAETFVLTCAMIYPRLESCGDLSSILDVLDTPAANVESLTNMMTAWANSCYESTYDFDPNRYQPEVFTKRLRFVQEYIDDEIEFLESANAKRMGRLFRSKILNAKFR